MEFKLNFNMDNDEFEKPLTAITRILKKAIEDIKLNGVKDSKTLRDINGNAIGKYEIIDDSDKSYEWRCFCGKIYPLTVSKCPICKYSPMVDILEPLRPTVKEIKIKSTLDESPDLSYLGEFSNDKGKYAIQHNGERGTYTFFNAANVENMKQAYANYGRIMKYENGDICDNGIIADCEILIPQGNNNFLTQKITSGGLWGISSDNDKAYIESIKKEQLNELKEILKLLNVEGIESVKIIDTEA